ncbi:LOW QUALITY PROTEIN: uncharacterized protein LOC105431540 [Pogonomyrmex barbatus]|uniref:LOW QUALITY PROTEIN: uncharacterized protein LOC105431540 n=1 Tax=Pogonomyrmex barbatus TaxID=144034 RepID=A0A6I9WW23_9HYME|nr:LOW QUALITY PROTEIN: uncharacterized protein LOC105431540 [Pogonomyrmex barbatus]
MNDEFDRNFEVIDRNAINIASGKDDAMDIDSIDLNTELYRVEKELDCCKPTLQSCREKYESTETEICDVKQLQCKAQFVLDNVQLEGKDLNERLKNIHVTYETCVKISGSEDTNETIRAKINELTTQRKTLMEELVQLRKTANDNEKKLARVNAMITDQEEKNLTLLQNLQEISESVVSIPQEIKKRIDTILKHQEIDENNG